MKRIRKIVNFFAFNLLFFALYLNFIHKDKAIDTVPVQTNAAVISETAPVQHPEKYLDSKTTSILNTPQASENKVNDVALKLSIN